MHPRELHSPPESAIFSFLQLTVLTIVNLMADSELESSYLHFIVTICLVHSVLEIFACDGQTDSAYHYYSQPPPCGKSANNVAQCIEVARVAPLCFLARCHMRRPN